MRESEKWNNCNGMWNNKIPPNTVGNHVSLPKINIRNKKTLEFFFFLYFFSSRIDLTNGYTCEIEIATGK